MRTSERGFARIEIDAGTGGREKSAAPEEAQADRESLRRVPGNPSVHRILASLALAAPLLLVCFALLPNEVNFPFLDDFDAILGFVNGLVERHGAINKAFYLLAAQHNEYKLLFEHAVVWLQYSLTGRIDFVVLCAIGNAFPLLVGLVLWRMFLPECPDRALRLALFVPVPWLLFQLQYQGTLNWAMASLQNLPVLLFAFASIYLLVKVSRRAFAGSTVLFVLAIASSGNGFFLLPIGLLTLLLRKQIGRATIWASAGLLCIAAYSYRYNVLSSQTAPHRSVFATLLHLNPIYVLSFIGSAASIPSLSASLVLGALLCLCFAWMARRGYARRNPAVSCCVLFLLLTAVGVAGIRSEFGVAQSVSSRYTIYSDLLVIFGWIAIAGEFRRHFLRPLLNNPIYLGAVATAVLFSLFSDGVGLHVLQDRHDSLLRARAAYEHPGSPGSELAPDVAVKTPTSKDRVFAARARVILGESLRLGVYRPPPVDAADVPMGKR